MRAVRPAVTGTAILIAIACGTAGQTGNQPDSRTPAATAAASSPGSAPVTPAPQAAVIAGIAFVDASVSGQGSRAILPANATVHPSGSKITGTDGCPSNRYGTDGLIVAVIDYTGRPTAASLKITERPDGGMKRERAPYQLDLNSGRTLQFLGPIRANGAYDLALEYDLAQGKPKSASGGFTLARHCQ